MEQSRLVLLAVPLVRLDLGCLDRKAGIVSHVPDAAEDEEVAAHFSLLAPAETHRNAGLVFLHRNAGHYPVVL